MYAKIIKAQQIMYVEDRHDISKEVSMDGADVIAYAVQYAWDKQDKELKALSRAFSELRSMMKAYDELSRSEKETEEQQARIELLRAKIASEKVKGNTETQIEYEDDGFIEALNSSTAADWSDYKDE
jgi:predicted translin family RNA/ssDNA-binding protein